MELCNWKNAGGFFARKLDFNKEFDNIKITEKVYKKAVYRNTKFGLLVP